jgi:hypothetical protein
MRFLPRSEIVLGQGGSIVMKKLYVIATVAATLMGVLVHGPSTIN